MIDNIVRTFVKFEAMYTYEQQLQIAGFDPGICWFSLRLDRMTIAVVYLCKTRLLNIILMILLHCLHFYSHNEYFRIIIFCRVFLLVYSMNYDLNPTVLYYA